MECTGGVVSTGMGYVVLSYQSEGIRLSVYNTMGSRIILSGQIDTLSYENVELCIINIITGSYMYNKFSCYIQCC